jgi:hypothetical protein
MSQSKKYVAVAANGRMRIMSVISDSEENARETIRRQLDRRGRRSILHRWQEDGEQVGVEDLE